MKALTAGATGRNAGLVVPELKERGVTVRGLVRDGERAQGDRVRQLVGMVAENVSGGTIPDCTHFVPEERPEEIVRRIRLMTAEG